MHDRQIKTQAKVFGPSVNAHSSNSRLAHLFTVDVNLDTGYRCAYGRAQQGSAANAIMGVPAPATLNIADCLLDLSSLRLPV